VTASRAALAVAAPPVPTPDLILSLSVRTSLEQTDDARVFGAVMLTYPAPQFGEVDPADVEEKMRGVAASLGAVPYGEAVPTVGARISMHGTDAVLWFAGCPYGLSVKHPRWATAAVNLGEVLLAVGLDELSPGASRAEVDEYRVYAAEAGRIHVAHAQIGSPHDVRQSLASAAGGAL
jgi:hypothetical protein